MTKKKRKKKKNKSKFNIKQLFNSTKFLLLVFVLLLILVITLVVLCIGKEKEASENGFANISFSLNKLKLPVEFNINASTLAQTDEYIFKVTNFNGKKVSNKEIKYTVIVENNTNSSISITVNDMDDNLMTNQKYTKFTDTLKKDKKEAVYYHVKTTSAGNLDSKDLINIRIED